MITSPLFTLFVSIFFALVFCTTTNFGFNETTLNSFNTLKKDVLYPYLIPGCNHVAMCPFLPIGPRITMSKIIKPCFRSKRCADIWDCNYQNDEICRKGWCMKIFCKHFPCFTDRECNQGICDGGSCRNQET